MREAVGDVLLNGQVRKKREVLEDVGDVPFSRGEIDAAIGVQQDFSADGNLSCVRMNQSGDAIEQRGFAGTGRAKENGDACRNFSGDVQYKGRMVGVRFTGGHQRAFCARERKDAAELSRRPRRPHVPAEFAVHAVHDAQHHERNKQQQQRHAIGSGIIQGLHAVINIDGNGAGNAGQDFRRP